MNVFELFSNKISEDQWHSSEGDPWHAENDQWGEQGQWNEETIVPLTGVDESLSFNSQKECMDYFEKIGKTRAQGAAAWNSTYANKKPKDSLSKVKPFDPKKHGNQWWMKEDQMAPQAQQAAQALQKGIRVAQRKYPNLDHSFAANVIREIKPDGTIIVAGENSTSKIKQLLAQGGGANFKVVSDAELQIAQQRPISQRVGETSSDVFANGDSTSPVGGKIDEISFFQQQPKQKSKLSPEEIRHAARRMERQMKLSPEEEEHYRSPAEYYDKHDGKKDMKSIKENNKIDPNDERPSGSLYTYRQIADKERFYKHHDERRFKSIRDWVADHPEDEKEMRSKYPQAFNQGVAEGSYDDDDTSMSEKLHDLLQQGMDYKQAVNLVAKTYNTYPEYVVGTYNRWGNHNHDPYDDFGEQGVAEGSLNEFAPDGFDGFEGDDRVPMHFIVEKDSYNPRSKWKKSYKPQGGGIALFTTKQEAIQAAEKFNKLDPNREFKYGGTQLVHVEDDDKQLDEFAPGNGDDDGEEFNPKLAKMAYDEGVVKGVSLADGAAEPLAKYFADLYYGDFSVTMKIKLAAHIYQSIQNGELTIEQLKAEIDMLEKEKGIKEQGVAEGAPIVVMPSHKRLEKKHKPSLSRGMDPAKAQGEQDARDGKPYNNPYPFKKELGAPGNWEHNSYKASYDSVKKGVAEGAPELLKAEMPLVRHIERELAQHGVQKNDPEYNEKFKHVLAYYRKFGNVDAIKKDVEEGRYDDEYGPPEYDPNEADYDELRAQDRHDRRYSSELARHPNCNDPDHPGCENCEGDDDMDDDINENESGVYRAIMGRIVGAHKGLIAQYGMDNVMDAARHVANWNTDVKDLTHQNLSSLVREVFHKLTGKVDESQKKNSHGHSKKQQAAIAIAKQGVAEGSLNESDKFTSWYDWKDQAKSSGYTITKKDDRIVALNKQGQVVGHWSDVGKFLSGKAPRPNFKRPAEQGVAEGSGKNVVKSIKVGNFRHDLVDTGMGWQVRIYNGDELYDTGLSKNSEQKGLAALEDAVAYTEKQTRTKRQGVAEGSGGNWYIRVNGKILNDTKFKPMIFSSEDEARSYAMKLADKKRIPLSQIKLTKSWMDAPEQGVAEGLEDTQKKIEDTINKLEDRLKHAKTDEQWDRISARIERLQAGLKRSKQGVAETAAWQKSSGKNKNGGLNKKGVASYRREHPGSKLKTAVTKKPSEIKKGSKDASRRKSFCARMKGMKKHNTSSKTAHDPNSRINKSLRKWHCESIEELQQMLMIAEVTLRTAEQLDESMRDAFLNKVAPAAVNAILESKKK